MLIWAALVDTDGVAEAVASARTHWAEVLLPRYARQPHVTLGYGGPVPFPGASPADPAYSPERLAEDRATLNRLRMPPFDVRIGGWDTFPMVPYLKAEAPELRQIATSLGEGKLRPYVPHVTLGHYAVEVPLSEVRAMASSWSWPEVSLRVNRLSLLRYDASDIAGPLTEVDCVKLGPPERA